MRASSYSEVVGKTGCLPVFCLLPDIPLMPSQIRLACQQAPFRFQTNARKTEKLNNRRCFYPKTLTNLSDIVVSELYIVWTAVFCTAQPGRPVINERKKRITI